MSRFPRPDYQPLDLYTPDRRPVALDLSDNTNLWGAPPAALAAVQAADDDVLTRYPLLYADDLKDAISQRCKVPLDSITTGCGSDDVLDSAFRAAGPGGGTVCFAGPTFSMVKPLALMNGRKPVEVPWSRALQSPDSLLEGDPLIVYVCRPNNPTGVSAPRSWLDKLLEAAGGSGGPLVILDEAYADFAPDSLLTEAPEIPNLLVTRTMSKAFGLAGFRVGFGVATPAVAREVEKSRGPYKVSRLSERAAVAALLDEDGWAQRTVAECAAARERLFLALKERGLQPFRSWANFILVPVPDGSAGWWNDSLRTHGVAVRPFPSCPDVGDALRVTVAPWPMLERFLKALDSVLAEGQVPAPEGARAARGRSTG
jgi:histidinol-phosphate aminotransferase